MFGAADRLGPNWPKIPATSAEQALSDAMMDYWVSFAATGKPTAKSQPTWPAFGQSRAYLRFADTPRPEQGFMPGMFELNEEVMCRRRASGSAPWNWNVGLASPPLPPKVTGC